MDFKNAFKALEEGRKIKLPTWLASQSDILSDDWYEVE